MDHNINDYIITRTTTRQQQHPTNYLSQNFICKQEINESESMNNLMNNSSSSLLLSPSSDPLFGELPQLESPTMPLVKRQSSISLVEVEEDDEKIVGGEEFGKKKVTDWRALDKFVASQLSHGNNNNNHNNNNKEEEDCDGTDDMGLMLLLQSGREEEGAGSKFSDFLNSTSDCDIGICVFDK